MIPFGVLFIWVNFLYVMFAYALGTIAYFTAKRYYPNYKNRIALSVFFIILFAPFWDLIIQKGIKTYYETFKMESTIYAYPERNKDGKIESLGIDGEVRTFTESYIKTMKDIEDLKKYYPVKSYLEVALNEKWEKVIIKNKEEVWHKKLKYIRLNIAKNPTTYDVLENEKDFKARYQVLSTKYEDEFFGFYQKQYVTFKDTKNNTILAKAWGLKFPSSKDKFRNKFLLWKSTHSSTFKIEDRNNYESNFKKLFGIKLFSWHKE